MLETATLDTIYIELIFWSDYFCFLFVFEVWDKNNCKERKCNSCESKTHFFEMKSILYNPLFKGRQRQVDNTVTKQAQSHSKHLAQQTKIKIKIME